MRVPLNVGKLTPTVVSTVTSRDRLRRSTILSALGPPLFRYSFVSGSSRAASQWVTHPEIALAPNSLNFGVPTTPKPVNSQKASELPKGLVLDGCGCAYVRHITPSPLIDVGSYNPPLLRARRPRRHTRTTRQSGSDTKLSHPEIGSAVTRYCPLWALLSARTVLFLGAHEQLPSGLSILGLLWPPTRLTSEFLRLRSQ
ncbi:hypothetical protein L3X38_003597 [Prunus dulcis]|uniref:Uncharacterized protein n=1 Tax=Prunus dulcis TaxID=3755 RepID=A0AAD4ZMC8_PRUDU|nr:hypothetical protein L3X38_003597 [Prunus dulcis]